MCEYAHVNRSTKVCVRISRCGGLCSRADVYSTSQQGSSEKEIIETVCCDQTSPASYLSDTVSGNITRPDGSVITHLLLLLQSSVEAEDAARLPVTPQHTAAKHREHQSVKA